MSWHATPEPGPIPNLYIEDNITSSADDVAKVSAMYAIAKSNGKAHVVILTDGLYSIAVRKADVMKSYIEKCAGCSVLSYADTPLANTSARIPQLTYSMVQKYGDKYNYTLAINDLYFDYMAPALKSLGRKKVRDHSIFPRAMAVNLLLNGSEMVIFRWRRWQNRSAYMAGRLLMS